MRSSSYDNIMKNEAKNFQKIRWRSAAFLLAENAVFLLTVYSLRYYKENSIQGY